jgi:hypothetical protein
MKMFRKVNVKALRELQSATKEEELSPSLRYGGCRCCKRTLRGFAHLLPVRA